LKAGDSFDADFAESNHTNSMASTDERKNCNVLEKDTN
jgi:hypothetical protein